MAEGLAAYPVLLGAFYGVYRVGREARSALLEHARLALMGLLLGVATAIQVGVAFRVPDAPAWATVFGALSLVGAFTLAGMHLAERLRERLPTLRAEFPVAAPAE